GQLRARAAVAHAAGLQAPQLLRMIDTLSRHGDDARALQAVLVGLREVLGFDRASLVAHIDGSEHAYVIAATDDPTLSQFTLRISQYPEIAECIRTGDAVLIDDAPTHPLTAPVAAKLAGRGVRAIAVFPILWRGRCLGVLLMRKASPGAGHVQGRGVDFARVATSLLAGHLRHGAVLESLREQTHRLSRVRFEAERRLRGIDSLRDHFDASDDGVVILDDGGRILFVNRAAERITGFARDGLIGSELGDLVHPDHRGLITDVVAQVLAGGNHEPFDLDLSTTTGAPACVSVSTSTVLASAGAVTLTFRDVTERRALETELRSTKEFLERLIDSTVDAIVAADMRGSIILFNQGAERIYLYRAEEVIGKLKVWELYPEGVARQIMRMLRSTSYGGVGRLEQTRREIRTKVGELVPVNMTASIIYEGDREVATVGIFSDLRERIRMEQKLLQAQQKLQLTEKQALVAELAGAAAHELNQPLTSIIGYSQLVQRQSPPEAPHLRAVGVILREAERMADIVKKIGRITKYETTPYVGSASIIDLEKSTSIEPVFDTPSSSETSSETGGDWEATREFDAARSSSAVQAMLGDLVDDPAVDPPSEETTPRARPSRDDASSEAETPRDVPARREVPGVDDKATVRITVLRSSERPSEELETIRPTDRDLGIDPDRGGGGDS
ncbi:MAG: PAS domain S-box protein, partial [Myxococcales bacterium]|nr:PAS domain S-box protein [Myxococcales bacterium]